MALFYSPASLRSSPVVRAPVHDPSIGCIKNIVCQYRCEEEEEERLIETILYSNTFSENNCLSLVYCIIQIDSNIFIIGIRMIRLPILNMFESIVKCVLNELRLQIDLLS